jgi:hypothetical protein
VLEDALVQVQGIAGSNLEVPRLDGWIIAQLSLVRGKVERKERSAPFCEERGTRDS